jgi:hypothetical protein
MWECGKFENLKMKAVGTERKKRQTAGVMWKYLPPSDWCHPGGRLNRRVRNLKM